MDQVGYVECPEQSSGLAQQFLMLLLQVLFGKYCNISAAKVWPNDYGPTVNAEQRTELNGYDFIIIGGGTAGSVLANRLSDKTDWKILLLEAGADPPIESEIPSMMPDLLHTSIDWKYRTESEPFACKALGNRCHWPRGKMLGGSSGMNAMVYIRGLPQDFDDWQEMGNLGWNWNSLKKYFLKSENIIEPSEMEEHFGRRGPQSIERMKKTDFYDTITDEAMKELGYDVGINLVDKFIGNQNLILTIAEGQRQSTAKSYLSPIRTRENLHVIKNAHVRRILFDDQKNANGVEFDLNGKRIIAKQQKEILLSAGAIGSPQLLMLSGIGPENDLNKLNITCLSDLPVGENLQDHISTIFFVKLSEPQNFTKHDQNQTESDHFFDYILNKRGPFSTMDLTNYVTFLNTVNESSPYPNVQIFSNYIPRYKKLSLMKLTSLPPELLASLVPANEHYGYLTLKSVLIDTKSKGVIKLRSPDPYEYPIIQPNYFSNRNDYQGLFGTVEYIRKLVATKAFSDSNGELVKPKIDACTKLSDDAEYWRCYIEHISDTLFHPVGTVKMGSPTDPTSVVNPELQVKGIQRLRVIDASIMPKIVRGNTNAPTAVIAEKASDLIKEYWQNVKSDMKKDVVHDEM